jgi:hypothetical protein
LKAKEDNVQGVYEVNKVLDDKERNREMELRNKAIELNAVANPLRDKARELATEFFNNMRLEEGSIVEKYFMSSDDGQQRCCVSDDVSHTLDVLNYRYYVGTLEDGCKGEIDYKTHTVTVAAGHENTKLVLLHELVHVFEYLFGLKEGYTNQYGGMVNPVRPYMRDALFMSLYWDLKERVKKEKNLDLDKLILKHGCFENQEKIIDRGGSHGILFYLISLDLDLRLGYDPGTICDYSEYEKDGEDEDDAG